MMMMMMIMMMMMMRMILRNNVKEKLFVSLAWLPKATVQAALGPVALGKAREALAEYIKTQAANILLLHNGKQPSW